MSTYFPVYPKFLVKRGQDQAITIQLVDGAGQPRNLTGVTAMAELRRSDTFALIETLAVAIPSPANGQVVVSWTSAQSNDWPITSNALRALFDVRLNFSGQIEHTETGELIIEREITNV